MSQALKKWTVFHTVETGEDAICTVLGIYPLGNAVRPPGRRGIDWNVRTELGEDMRAAGDSCRASERAERRERSLSGEFQGSCCKRVKGDATCGRQAWSWIGECRRPGGCTLRHGFGRCEEHGGLAEARRIAEAKVEECEKQRQGCLDLRQDSKCWRGCALQQQDGTWVAQIGEGTSMVTISGTHATAEAALEVCQREVLANRRHQFEVIIAGRGGLQDEGAPLGDQDVPPRLTVRSLGTGKDAPVTLT